MANRKGQGRKPKPSAVKEINGAYKINPQRRNESEPEVPEGWPPEPTDMDATTAAKWRQTCLAMESMRILSPVYASTIEAYSRTWGHYKHCEEVVAKTGEAIVGRDVDGNVTVKRNQYSVELHKFRDALLRFESELGLTPSSKSRLSAGSSAATDPFAEYLRNVGNLN